MDFVVPMDNSVKMKENKKIDKYLDHARELKNMWNMMVMVILIVVGMFGTVSGGLEEILQKLVWFLCFNGISNFGGYLMPKQSL